MNPLTAKEPQTDENTVTIVLTEVIGDTVCIASQDGRKVGERIAAALKQGQKVTVSFKDAEDITPAFLHDAIAQLYHEFPEELIKSRVSVVDIEPIDKADLEETIYWTKRYLEDTERYMSAAREAFGDYYYD